MINKKVLELAMSLLQEDVERLMRMCAEEEVDLSFDESEQAIAAAVVELRWIAKHFTVESVKIS